MADQKITLTILTELMPAGLDDLKKNLAGAQKLSAKTGIGFLQLAGQAQNTGRTINDQGDILGKNNRALGKTGRTYKTFIRSTMAPFRGEFLGMLFLGMGVNRMFRGMIDPVLKLAGVFDVWRATLITVLGPVLFPLAQILIKIMIWFMKLPEPVKKWIGVMVVVGTIISTAILIFAQLALAAMPFAKVFGGIIPAIKFFGTILGKIFIWVGAIVAIAIGLFEVITNWGKSMWKVGRGIMMIIGGIAVIVALVASAPVALVAGIIAAIAFILVFASKLKFVQAIFEVIGKIVTAIVDGIVWVAKKIGGGVSSIFRGGGNVPIPLASGGIVTRPTLAMIGERGPEAVVPLSGGGSGSGLGAINYSPTINVSLASADSLDLDNLAKQINSRLYDDLRRVGIR